MSNKVSCLECGVAILVSTAEKNGGLCMPCKGGYKDREEEFKRYCEKQRKYYLITNKPQSILITGTA